MTATLPGNLVYELPSLLDPLEFSAMFPAAQPVEVELGSGDASFLAAYAQSHPERNFIGVERLLGRIRKLDRKGRRRGLSNLRGVRLEASYFLKYLLPAASIEALHVYFPDPWPKLRHHRLRLVNAPFTEAARQALRPGACVHLRTDDASYYEQMLEVFGASDAFERVETAAELLAFVTDFEQEFLAAGRQTLRVSYRRR